MSRLTGVRPAAVGIVAIAVVLAGCSSNKTAASATSSTGSSPAASAVASAVPSGSAAPATGTGLKGDPAAIALVQDAVKNLAKVKTVHITGQVTDTGQNVTFDVKLGSATGATGSLTFQGGTINLIVLPSAIYVQADQKAFAGIAALAGSAATGPEAAQLSQLAGKWVKIADLTKATPGSTNPLGKVNSYSDFGKLSEQFKTASGTVKLLDKKTINGQDAQGVQITGTKASDSAVLYVQAGGDHLPLELVPSATTAGTTGKIDASDYNKPIIVTAPAGAIDISSMLSGLLGGAATPSPSS
jgi:hypothetical protein